MGGKEGRLRLIMGILINLSMGTIYSWSVFRTPLEEQLGISSAESGLPYMIFLAVFSFSMPLGGLIINRLGPRRAVRIAGVLLAGGWISAGFAGSISMIVLSYGVLGGLAVGIAYGVPLSVAGRWFPENRGFAMGLALLGFGLSPFITAPLAELLIESFGIMMSFRLLGLLFFTVLMVFGHFMVFPSGISSYPAALRPEALSAAEDRSSLEELQQQSGSGHAGEHPPRMAPAQMMKTREFYGLWILYMGGTLSGLMAIGITSPAARELTGIGGQGAALLVSVMAVFNGLGRPVFGSLTDKIGARASIMLASLLIAGASSIMLFFAGSSLLLLSLGFALFWFTLGGWLAIAPAATTALFGSLHYTRNYGIMYTAYGVGAIAGTLLSGSIHDHLGSYRPAFWPILIMALLSLLAVRFLIPGRKLV